MLCIMCAHVCVCVCVCTCVCVCACASAWNTMSVKAGIRKKGMHEKKVAHEKKDDAREGDTEVEEGDV